MGTGGAGDTTSPCQMLCSGPRYASMLMLCARRRGAGARARRRRVTALGVAEWTVVVAVRVGRGDLRLFAGIAWEIVIAAIRALVRKSGRGRARAEILGRRPGGSRVDEGRDGAAGRIDVWEDGWGRGMSQEETS